VIFNVMGNSALPVFLVWLCGGGVFLSGVKDKSGG